MIHWGSDVAAILDTIGVKAEVFTKVEVKQIETHQKLHMLMSDKYLARHASSINNNGGIEREVMSHINISGFL